MPLPRPELPEQGDSDDEGDDRPAAPGISPHHGAPPCATPLPYEAPAPHLRLIPPHGEGHRPICLFSVRIPVVVCTCLTTWA